MAAKTVAGGPLLKKDVLKSFPGNFTGQHLC